MSGSPFAAMGLDRLTSDLRLSVEPALAARVRELLLRPAGDAVEAAEAIATATELRLIADAAAGRPGFARGEVTALRRAEAVLLLRADDPVEGVRLLLEVHAELLAPDPSGSPPAPEDVGMALWCMAAVAVAHHEAGRHAEAAAAARTAREDALRAHAEGTIGAGDLIDLETVLAFGASDPLQARGAIRSLERDAMRLLGPSDASTFLIRDLHGELLAVAGERRRATRHYAALAADLARDRGPSDELTVRARSSHAFAVLNEGGPDADRRAHLLYRDLVRDLEVAAAAESVSDEVVAMVRRNWLQFLVGAARHSEAETVFEVAVAAARAALAGAASSADLRTSGGAMVGREAGLAMLLDLRAQSLMLADRPEDAAPVLLELLGIVERGVPVPGAPPSRVLFRAVRCLHQLDRDAEAVELLREALNRRSDRDGWGSEPHIAAFTVAVYTGQQRSGAGVAAEMAVVPLAIMDEVRDPSAERHRPALEAMRDGRGVTVHDLLLDA